MKKVFIFGLFLLFAISGNAQRKDYTIKFKEKIKPFKANFNYSGVIDRRLIKENVGYVQIGLSNKRVPALFEGKFEEVIEAQVPKVILDDADGEKIYFVFHALNVGERISGMSERGSCRMEIEFVKKIDSTYYSYGTFTSEVEGKGMDVTGGHDRRILQALKECIIGFESSILSNNSAVEIFELEETSFPYNYNEVPAKGMYSSFPKMAKNEPMENFDIQFSRIRIDSKHKNNAEGEKYKLKILNKEDKKKRIIYISNGKEIFMHASRFSYATYYLKSKHIGRYIYFEDRFPSQMAGYAFGLIGTIASNKLRGILLDTSNGQVVLLNKSIVYNLVKEYKDISKPFVNSKKKTEDMEAAIVALNKKYME